MPIPDYEAFKRQWEVDNYLELHELSDDDE